MFVVSRHGSAFAATLAVCLMLVGLAGCSKKGEDFPDLFPASGTVTLDGQPLTGAQLSFEPEVGPSSFATTDDKGNYEVFYQVGVKGAVTGTHTVRITKSTSDDPADLSGETVPPKYNRNSELTVTVAADGENTFDFALTTK